MRDLFTGLAPGLRHSADRWAAVMILASLSSGQVGGWTGRRCTSHTRLASAASV